VQGETISRRCSGEQITGQYLIDRERTVAEQRTGCAQGVEPLIDGDLGQLLRRSAVLVHMALGDHAVTRQGRHIAVGQLEFHI
jgi:hypothetical protein